ncbi:Fic family protein [Methylocystis sp. IM3]|uniref:Fic/DOC family protein n=1 Tax=Methylocystis sp. IM3 TaxID=3136722 RepID=UPI0031191540
MSPRGEAERAEYEKIVYPDTQVLVNQLGIREAATLDAAERLFTDIRIAEGLPFECTEPTYGAFRAIHRHLFQDLYSWAGDERKYTTGRGPAPFAVPEQITPWMERQFEAFRVANQLRGLAPTAFAEQAAVLVNEINAAHPFIEGNGRVQRIWLAGVAERAGYEFSIRPEDREPWYSASRIGFQSADPAPMFALLLSRIQALDDAERSKHSDRASQFLALSREQGLASDDASFKAAWLNIEKIGAIARSAMPFDPEGQQAIVTKAREQLADHIRAGARIAEITEQQAWRNTLGRDIANPACDVAE